MKYLFSNKNIKVGDICSVLCNEEQYKTYKFDKLFPKASLLVSTINRFGIKVVKVTETKIYGYMVYIAKDQSNKIYPYKINNKYVYCSVTNSNCICIFKYK